MKFAVISFIFIGFIYQKVQIFLLRCIFSSHVHTLLSSMSCFFMLLSFYTQIFLVTPFLICNYPLFFSPFFINLSSALPSSYSLFFLPSFQSPSFHSSIFEGFSFLHHPPVLDCLPLLPSTFRLFTFSSLFHSMTNVQFRDHFLFQMKNKSDNYWVVGLDEKSQQIR